MVEDEFATDPKTAELLSKTTTFQFDGVQQTGSSLQLNFSVNEINTVRYDQKLKSRRYVQSYRPRWGWLLAGVGLSSGLFYFANTTELDKNQTIQVNQILLNALSLSVLTGSFYIQKPIGNPQKTEEVAYLSKTGTIIKTDTSLATLITKESVFVRVYFKNQLWVNGVSLPVKDGKLSLPLYDFINPDPIQLSNNDQLIVDVEYGNEFQEFFIPANQVLFPYVSFKSNGYIYAKPELSKSNQITQTEPRSLYPFLRDSSTAWSVIQFGPAKAFVKKSETEIVWTKKGIDAKKYVTNKSDVYVEEEMSQIEWNIPFETRRPKNPLAILIHLNDQTNSYKKDTFRALRAYLVQTFGYESDEIIEITNTNTQNLLEKIAQLAKSDIHEEVSIYVNGIWSNENNPTLKWNVENSTQKLEFEQLLRSLKQIKSSHFRVLMDISFSEILPEELSFIKNLTKSVESFLATDKRGFVWFSTKYGQKSKGYSLKNGGQELNYSSFIYYYLLGIKQKMIVTESLKVFTEKELNFYSRKTQNRPQETLFFGNAQLNLLQ